MITIHCRNSSFLWFSREMAMAHTVVHITIREDLTLLMQGLYSIFDFVMYSPE